MSRTKGVLILDFGSQYNQLIARRIREMGVYTKILPFYTTAKDIKALEPKGIIYSGGPASVYDSNAPLSDPEIINLGIPILGICYGMQIIAHQMGGEIAIADKREFGKTIIKCNSSSLFEKVPTKHRVWMSHADRLIKSPLGFSVLAKSENSIAAIANELKDLYCLQFHPEVTHSEYGTQILRNFVFEICACTKNWHLKNFIDDSIQNIRSKVGNSEVILGLSGGVDSSVAAVLIHRAIGDQLKCILVDTGLLRKNEAHQIMETYSNDHFNINIQQINANGQFLSKLRGITDPEKKRKIIGAEFVKIFQEEAQKHNNALFLAQGTIYPDVIESQSVNGPSATIKSHHNVGGLPKKMGLKLLEPLRSLFKDEVRKVGLELGIPEKMIFRHPFPGPGLAIRILGEVTPKKIEILQNADDILIQELKKSNLYKTVNQAFVVLLPIKSVGVMGDLRTYEYTAVIRSTNTADFMTATWSRLPYDLLERVSNRIINEVKGINRVTYDISSKPPSTIEWE